MLVVDPWHWLNADGSLPRQEPRLYRRILRVAQFIEAGGPLPALHARQTLLGCAKRPNGTACVGLIWVVKTEDDTIHAFCPTCHADEALIQNWQRTEWADGPREPLAVHRVAAQELN